jgi:hypothetical protein
VVIAFYAWDSLGWVVMTGIGNVGFFCHAFLFFGTGIVEAGERLDDSATVRLAIFVSLHPLGIAV